MRKLVIFDTSNYTDYPIGGQLTSIRNFLLYIAKKQNKFIDSIYLIGVTNDKNKLGKETCIKIDNHVIRFFSVAYANNDLNKISKSLRLEYLKGLFIYGKKISINKNDVFYIQTPEAYIFKRICFNSNYCYTFSHGDFFEFKNNIRFFNKSSVFKKIIDMYFKYLISNSNCVFVLDEGLIEEYKKYNSNILKVSNSIVCKEKIVHELDRKQIKLLYVGRLSKTKRVDAIIKANELRDDSILYIAGAGEEYEELRRIASKKTIFLGALNRDEINRYMKESNILILNSTTEGIPMTILEAKSSSLPIVTTNVGGISQLMSYGSDSEDTNGQPESINIAINKILRNYDDYCSNSYNSSLNYDYLIVNENIFNELNTILHWR